MLGGTGSCLFIEILKKKTTTRFRGLWEVNSHKLLKVEFILTIGPYLPPFMSSANSNSFKASKYQVLMFIPQWRQPLYCQYHLLMFRTGWSDIQYEATDFLPHMFCVFGCVFQLLAEAIKSVTEMNPDLSVERIECMRQIEDVDGGREVLGQY